MSEENVRLELKKYVTNNEKWFYWYHDPDRLTAIKHFIEKDLESCDKDSNCVLEDYLKTKGHPINEVLCGFLASTLDEARLKKANDFSFYALYISDKRSFAYFRRAESKREVSGEIDYDKQRDHAVHTLYNYLLGWYAFEHILDFRKAFRNTFQRLEIISEDGLSPKSEKERQFYTNTDGLRYRPVNMEENYFFDDLDLFNHFGDIWPIASLLHDVGYILEGSLSPATSQIEHERVINGSKVLHDYFNHWLWRHAAIDYRAARNIAKKIGCVVPDFKSSRSMPALADRLRDIGNLENVRKKCEEDNKRSLDETDSEEYSLNHEVFHLWSLFYKRYHPKTTNSNFICILEEVKRNFYNDVWEGGISSKINLNHGVCGGLMLLQASTFWYDLHWGLESKDWGWIDALQKEQQAKHEPSDYISEQSFKTHHREITVKRIPAHIRIRGGFHYSDWIKDLWATASVAIHDYIAKDTWNDDDQDRLRIDLEVDPLAYLEILVDLLQEWDRYTVLGESAFSGKEVLQSYETKLSIEIGEKNNYKMRLAYPNRKVLQSYKKEMEKLLKKTLINWSNYVDITEEPPRQTLTGK